jgi:hypothetical protein
MFYVEREREAADTTEAAADLFFAARQLCGKERGGTKVGFKLMARGLLLLLLPQCCSTITILDS